MTNYVLVYRGGGVPDSEEEQQKVMAAWGAWMGELGGALVDGGNPFGSAKSIAADGTVSDGGASSLTGYSILKAESLDEATKAAGGCPILTSGGSVEVYETFAVM